jgi:hypothetical protein
LASKAGAAWAEAARPAAKVRAASRLRARRTAGPQLESRCL